METKRNKYQDHVETTTARIVELLEDADPNGWVAPWYKLDAAAFRPTNVTTNKGYQGVNVLNLWLAASDNGWGSGYWATYKQWQSLGAQVQKGSTGTHIVKWIKVKREKGDERRGGMFPKVYTVFAAEQVDGWELPEPPAPLDPTEHEADIRQWAERTAVTWTESGDRAYYNLRTNVVTMPPYAIFRSFEGWAGTLFHEFTHATGHEGRTNRHEGAAIQSEGGYAFEELVAELGAAFLCSIHQVSPEPREDHAQYIASWITLLKGDPKALVRAASAAGKATHWLQDKAEANTPELVTA
jgi:antirestriction protein ArdC